MGFQWSSRVGEGVNIKKNGNSIDVIVRKIGGSTRNREAMLEVIVDGKGLGVPLVWYSNFVEVGGGVKIRISEKTHTRPNQVSIYYEIQGDYERTPTTYFPETFKLFSDS